jgi:glycosyltransferase involved in cell wall biosynthesis
LRVLHISTSDASGGAARAAFGLHCGLREHGVDSRMLVRHKASTDATVTVAPVGRGTAARRMQRRYRLIQKYLVDRRRTKVSNTLFSLDGPGYDLSRLAEARDADVLHVHWVSRLVSHEGIRDLAALGKRMVWTLHDQRAFTGGCHFSAGCERFQTACHECPQLERSSRRLPAMLLEDSIAALEPARRIRVVCPSRWLAECARSSAVFQGVKVDVIPNSIRIDIFRPRDKAACRTQLGVPPTGFYYLFGADSLGEHRKGAALLADALSRAAETPKFARALRQREIQVLGFGVSEGRDLGAGVAVHSFGRVTDDATLAAIYGAADVFILPSREDNLPNTMLEAMCCGTPVLACNVGGIPDAVIEGQSGWLSPPEDAVALARLVAALPWRRSSVMACQDWCAREAGSRYAPAVQAGRYAALYDRLPAAPGRAEAAWSEWAASADLSLPGARFGAAFTPLLVEARRERIRAKLRDASAHVRQWFGADAPAP